jgi:hypothetical protein
LPLLLSPGTRVSDADGNPLSGAKVRVYTANTTSLASLFSDDALTVPLLNPVETNADGYPSSDGSNECLIWIASGEYDLAFLNSSDVILASWDDVQPVGNDGGDLDRTVSGNGRFRLTGSAGDVLIQVGSPSPDDTGGTLTIEGWDGTQLDELILDAASTELSGDLTVKGGKKLVGVVQTPATAFAAASTVDIELVNSPTGVRAWRVDLFDVSTTEVGGDALQARLSYDGGGSYKNGAADYGYVHAITLAAGTTTAGSTGATEMVLAAGFETGANRPAKATMEIVTPDSGNDATTIEAMSFYTDPGAATAPAQARASCWGLGSYGRATHLRIIAPAGSTITGKYRVTPLYGFGE